MVKENESLYEKRGRVAGKINALHNKVANFAELSDAFIFILDAEKNGSKFSSLTSFENTFYYVKRVFYWPQLGDGRMSSKILIIDDDHTGEDDSYSDYPMRELYYRRMPRLPLFLNGEINTETIDLLANNLYGGHNNIGVLEADKIIGNPDLDSIRELP